MVVYPFSRHLMKIVMILTCMFLLSCSREAKIVVIEIPKNYSGLIRMEETLDARLSKTDGRHVIYADSSGMCEYPPDLLNGWHKLRIKESGVENLYFDGLKTPDGRGRIWDGPDEEGRICYAFCRDDELDSLLEDLGPKQ